MRKKITKDFILDAIKVHGDKYDYSESEYDGNKNKVKIFCKSCRNFFEQSPNHHLRGRGCLKCSGKEKYNTEKFIENSKKIHGDKYDYSLTKYTDAHKFVNIICPTHGIFSQKANSHLNGRGCPKCGIIKYGSNQRIKFDDFMNKSKDIHGSKYVYNKDKYETQNKKIEIICPIHGIFLQKPYKHSGGQGCPKCYGSMGENRICVILDNNKISYIRNHSFADCKYKMPLRFDFYIPKIKTAIEFDGRQHFEPVSYFGGEIGYQETIKRDDIKNKYCISNNINLIRISNIDDIKYSLKNIINLYGNC